MSIVYESKFRDDIQGLRGIAVLLVVIYHSGIGLPGGFVGVDMFFVISGFVITQLLVRELDQTGAISFRNFYARRARRLLPALGLVTVATLALSVFVISPFAGQREVAQTAQATTLFLANAYLFLQDTYFSLKANPFRHMWSLAVEEQFYLILPVALFIGWKLTSRLNRRSQRTTLAIAVVTISSASFVFGALLSFGNRITPFPERFAFFGTPSRVWEFGIGVLLVLIPKQNKFFMKLSPSLFLVSFAAIIWSAVELEISLPFPGVVALIPVVATGYLIFSADSSRFAQRILTWSPLVALGNVSYGWYLWHWPLIVFSLTLWPENTTYALLAGVLALIPTALSYRLIEQPIRKNSQIIGIRALGLASICIILPVSFSIATDALARTGLGLEEPDVAPMAGAAENCGFTADQDTWPQTACTFTVANSQGKIFLFGDSQARAYADGVIKAGNALGYDVAVLATAGCPMLSRAPLGVSWCEDIQYRLGELIRGCVYQEVWSKAADWCEGDIGEYPKLVVIANSQTRYMQDELRIPLDTGRLPTYLDQRISSYSTALSAMIDEATALGVPVLNVYEPPSVTINPYVSLIRPKIEIGARKLSSQASRNNMIKVVESKIVGENSVLSFDPSSIICASDSCSPFKDGKIIYHDSTHLNILGSTLLSDAISKKMQALLG